MINRGVSQTSAYFFNAETGMLEKIDENVQTIESLSSKMGKTISDVDEITEEVNKEEEAQPINNITVITAEDNLIHNYFSHMEVSWDASNCLATATIKMPKMDTENTNYWSTYTGQLTIYAGYNFTFDYVNANAYPTETDAAQSLTKYWDNSDIKPFFRGEIGKVKEEEKNITIYVNNIGIRFQQKIPDEFRQAFIYNQNVRDAFQAICEFLGVEYICPPQTVTDDGSEIVEDEQPSADGRENNVSQQQQTTRNIQNTVKNLTQNNNNQSNKPSTNSSNNDTATEDGMSGTASEDGSDLENNTEIEEGPQNGYGDINFDANGAIVHGSTVIETSPDMAETLLAMDENPLEKYLEDETGIVEKVQKFLNGDMFEELHNKVMNYDAITIEPKAAASTEMSGVGDTAGGTGENGEDSNSSGGSNFDWERMSKIINKYFNKNNPNKNTIIAAFRNCSDDWSCLAGTYSKYKKYCSASNQDKVIREIRTCFK